MYRLQHKLSRILAALESKLVLKDCSRPETMVRLKLMAPLQLQLPAYQLLGILTGITESTLLQLAGQQSQVQLTPHLLKTLRPN